METYRIELSETKGKFGGHLFLPSASVEPIVVLPPLHPTAASAHHTLDAVAQALLPEYQQKRKLRPYPSLE
jgi:hypothetical protein